MLLCYIAIGLIQLDTSHFDTIYSAFGGYAHTTAVRCFNISVIGTGGGDLEMLTTTIITKKIYTFSSRYGRRGKVHYTIRSRSDVQMKLQCMTTYMGDSMNPENPPLNTAVVINIMFANLSVYIIWWQIIIIIISKKFLPGI